MGGATVEGRLAQLLAENPGCFTALSDGRVRCELNGHVFPANGATAAVAAFVGGAKFRKLRAKRESETKLERLAPFLLPSRNLPGHLWCALTKQLLVADVGTAKRHMAGRKFQNAKERFTSDEQDLFEEPDMGEDDEMEEEVEGVEGVEANEKEAAVEKGEKEEAAEFWVPEWAEEAVGSEGEGGEGEGGEGEVKKRRKKKGAGGEGEKVVQGVTAKGKGKVKRNPNKQKAKRRRAS